MNTLTDWAEAHSLEVAAVAAAVALILSLLAVWVRRSRTPGQRTPAAVVVASLAAMACTAYSADTSWRFAEDHLGMTSGKERAAMFAAAELALFACALMARQNLHGGSGTPGTPGVIVWFITGVQVIPAFAESGVVGGTVRAVVGPILAALLWHLAMGIELRHSRPDAGSQSLPAVIGRELRERLLSRLGLATRDRTAEQITRDRATARAVQLAARPKLHRWGRARLAAAVARAGVGTDPGQRDVMMRQLAARRGAANLNTISLPSPWAPAEITADRAPGPAGDAPAHAVEVERVPEPPAPVYPALPESAQPVPEVSPEPVPEPSASRYPLGHFDSWRQEWVTDAPPRALAAEVPPSRTEVRAEYTPEVSPTAPHPEPAEDWRIDGTYANADGSPAEPDEDILDPDPLLSKVAADHPDGVGVNRMKSLYSIGGSRAQRIRDQLITQGVWS
ncbi:hypothetical protein [Streptomyces sp. NPDC059786]|uniref:hypothetical protein n=1 Tax=Streptomyces sp. NPDC059786 TaxID=3346946 RepID=UPI003667C069